MGSVNTLVEGLIEGLYMVLPTNYLVYQGFSIDSRNLFFIGYIYIYLPYLPCCFQQYAHFIYFKRIVRRLDNCTQTDVTFGEGDGL